MAKLNIEPDRRPWVLLSPALVFITMLVVIPMAFILVYSFYENIDLAVDVPAFQFGNWQELLTDSYYHTAIWKTLRLSVIVTVLAAVLGYIPAYLIAMTNYRHKWLLLLVADPAVLDQLHHPHAELDPYFRQSGRVERACSCGWA